MNNSRKNVAALLCVTLIILSVFTNIGFTVRAQAIEYLNSLEVKSMLKDTGSSTYGTVSTNNAITGKSGAVYSNGIAVNLTRDCGDGASFIALTYTVPNNAASFAGYLDLNKDSQNTSNFAVKFEVYTDDTVAYSQTLTPSTEYPVKLNVAVSGAKEITVKFSDTAPNEGATSFVVGNAALCESGSSIPQVTVPEQEEDEEDEDVSTTDLSANAQQLLAQSKKYLGHNYLFVTMQISWEQAATWCEMQGGYLATIESEAENKFIADYLRSLGNKTAYFGLQNSTAGGELKWQNGETAKYFNWGRQSVTNSNAKYMMITGGSEEWTLGTADEAYLNFVIEWGEKEVLTEDENKPNDKAVIIIAGLGGSVLSDSDGDAAWGNKSGTYTELDLSKVMTDEKISPAGSKYGVSDTYKPLIEEVSKLCSDSDVMLYEWDWRNSGIDAVDGLSKLIEDGGWSDVTLVGHNTGGLVALYYIGENETDGISRIITLGTPFYGTEKAFYIMKSGMFAQGSSEVRGTLYSSASKLEALHSMIPDSPNVGTEGFTGKLLDILSKDDVFENVGINRTDADSALLKNVYETVKNGEFGGMYIVAGTGTATVESIALDGDGNISEVRVSLEGDGLTDVGSAAMNFESARPPYIIENTSVGELVTSEDSIKLLCNILSGIADTANYADGLSRSVYRSAQENVEKTTEISISGNARITVQTDSQTVTLSGSGYSFSGDPQCGLMYGENVKSVFVTDNAQIHIEILGNDVCFEMSGENGTVSWSGIPLGSGAELKTTANSNTLTVATDPDSTGITEIKADTIPTLGEVFEEVIEEPEEEEEKLNITWNIWVAIGLVVAAAAVALILMPYFAYRVSKVETDRKKRALKRALRQRRQQRNPQGTTPQAMADIPSLPAMQDGTVQFDINDVLSGDAAVDFDILSNN